MYWVRTFQQGAGDRDYDPRLRKYAVFHCDCCQKEDWVDITGNNAFDTSQQRRCPDCNSMGKNDYINTLKNKKEQLTENRSSIEQEIEKIIKEIEELETKDV